MIDMLYSLMILLAIIIEYLFNNAMSINLSKQVSQ